jgi:hypothetical protein
VNFQRCVKSLVVLLENVSFYFAGVRIAGDLRIDDPHPIAFLIGWGVVTERLGPGNPTKK